MLLSIVYVLARRVLSLVLLRFRTERSKDLELVVLRHELSVPRRQVTRLQLNDSDRVFLAAASRLLARKHWSTFFVTPVLGRRHLESVLNEHVAHYNSHLHHALELMAPGGTAKVAEPGVEVAGRVRRTDRLGGLVHEYHRQAA